jgi:hypothetical protein
MRTVIDRSAPSSQSKQVQMAKWQLFEEYAPYHNFAEFHIGFDDYTKGRYRNPFGSSVAGQSWDRGAEAAMRWQRLQSK